MLLLSAYCIKMDKSAIPTTISTASFVENNAVIQSVSNGNEIVNVSILENCSNTFIDINHEDLFIDGEILGQNIEEMLEIQLHETSANQFEPDIVYDDVLTTEEFDRLYMSLDQSLFSSEITLTNSINMESEQMDTSEVLPCDQVNVATENTWYDINQLHVGEKNFPVISQVQLNNVYTPPEYITLSNLSEQVDKIYITEDQANLLEELLPNNNDDGSNETDNNIQVVYVYENDEAANRFREIETQINLYNEFSYYWQERVDVAPKMYDINVLNLDWLRFMIMSPNLQQQNVNSCLCSICGCCFSNEAELRRHQVYECELFKLHIT